jgi:hypothetical protein
MVLFGQKMYIYNRRRIFINHICIAAHAAKINVRSLTATAAPVPACLPAYSPAKHQYHHQK